MPISYSCNMASFKWSPDISLSCINCPNPTLIEGIKTLYMINIKSNVGCEAADSIYIELKENKYTLPNVIIVSRETKDNNIFFLNGVGNTSYEIEIYDRWGNNI